MPSSAESVATLFAAHRDELVGFVERRLGSRATAEDLVQQAAVRALARADSLRDERGGRAWLFTITRRLVADFARGRSELSLTDEPVTEEEVDDYACACVLSNLAHIHPSYAQALRRVVLEGASLQELSGELGLTRNATTVRLSRARAALRAQLQSHCGTSSLRACLACVCDERGCCGATEVGDPPPAPTHPSPGD